MACSSMNIPTSHIITAKRGGIQGEGCTIRRSSSVDDLCRHATMRRSYSDNNLHSQRTSSSRTTKLKASRSFGIFPHQLPSSIVPSPIRALLIDHETGNETKSADNNDTEAEEDEDQRGKKGNWVERLLELRTRWKGRKAEESSDENKEKDDDNYGDDGEGCEIDYSTEEEEEEEINRVTFSKLLNQAPWSEAQRLNKLAFLCNKAYRIPEIKAHELKQHHGLHLVTSSLEKKAEAIALKIKLGRDSTLVEENDTKEPEVGPVKMESRQEKRTHPSFAYEIAASAASHVQSSVNKESCTSICEDLDHVGDEREGTLTECKSERAAQMAASAMTAVVAAREREKQEAAEELQSLHSSPCDWFICDDPSTHVRYFIIQGSESLAAWQTNLFFEPTKFEGTDALVHRGIYEAAKGIYEQFMPEIINHINAHGDKARFQFTGHSLGGSLSLLVHIMLIARKTVKLSNLLPVVTFGSPFVFCRGLKTLEQWGIDENQVHCVLLHRDIVPRAFSCIYPRQVALVLMRLNGSFRSHPCLNAQKMLYSPLGRIFILQPAETLSPSHPLLPPGSALHVFDKTRHAPSAKALKVFLNTPHPLETLSDLTAYGSDGTILRDHDSSNYAKALNGVTRQHKKAALQKIRNERRLIWPVSPISRSTWTREGNLENRSATATKELMTTV